MKVKFVLLFLLAIFIVVFTLQNTQVVEIKFVFWDFHMSRVLLIFIMLGIGMLGGLLIGGLSRKKHVDNG